MSQQIRLKCFKEGSKLRVRIISPGYISAANCRFPRDIRVEDREYLVPQYDITLIDSRFKYFYSIRKTNIQIVDSDRSLSEIKNLKVYGDIEAKNPECNICMDTQNELIIFAPCGHYCSCAKCAQKLDKCPMCRTNINQIVKKDQLE